MGNEKKRNLITIVGTAIIVLIVLVLYCLTTNDTVNTGLNYHSDISDTRARKYIQPQDILHSTNLSFKHLPSGWDDRAVSIYNAKSKELETELFKNETAIKTVHIQPSGDSFRTYNRVFWRHADTIPVGWEEETYQIFFHFTNSDTIIVDFGTWVGPTVLYGMQFVNKVYGVEADPAAYAEMMINIKLNSDKPWYRNIYIQPGCVASPNDVGTVTMKSYNPGNSCSGIGEKIGCGKVEAVEWNVTCYTLDYLLNYWGILNYIYTNDGNLFIKIDIESYECKLIPTFYEWLSKLPNEYLPTFYISYHPQITTCTDEEYFQFAKMITLYPQTICGPLRFKKFLFVDNNQRKVDDILKFVTECNENGKESTFTLTTNIYNV